MDATDAIEPIVFESFRIKIISARAKSCNREQSRTHIPLSKQANFGTSETRGSGSRSKAAQRRVRRHRYREANKDDERRTPPDVGAADASSAIDMPTKRMNMLATSHCDHQTWNT